MLAANMSESLSILAGPGVLQAPPGRFVYMYYTHAIVGVNRIQERKVRLSATTRIHEAMGDNRMSMLSPSANARKQPDRCERRTESRSRCPR